MQRDYGCDAGWVCVCGYDSSCQQGLNASPRISASAPSSLVGLAPAFTGKERDSETGLDYFGARYFSGATGRFASPDPLWVTAKRLVDPQRLNLYAYVRNNPLRYVDPDGLDLAIDAKTAEEARKKYGLFQLGLTKTDRAHTSFFVGDGKDGYQKGKFYVKVDAGHKSTSENFQFAQTAANDRTALGLVSVVGKGDSITVRVSSGWSATEGATPLTSMSMMVNGPTDPFAGYTFFQYRGKDVGTSPFSAGPFSQVVANAMQDDGEIAATIHHEIRHLVLGDFGRSIPKAGHSPTFNADGKPRTDVDRSTVRAEEEARRNAQQ